MENKPKSAVIIASNRPYCAAFLSCLEKQGDRLCRGCEKMLDKGQPHMGRCSASLFEQYMHNCTITQRSQFRDDSRIMQSFLIGRLLSSALAADWRYDCSEVEYLNLHRYAMRHIYMGRCSANIGINLLCSLLLHTPSFLLSCFIQETLAQKQIYRESLRLCVLSAVFWHCDFHITQIGLRLCEVSSL